MNYNKKNRSLTHSNEKEIKRWNNFHHTLQTNTPIKNYTPRSAVWKKNKAVLWYYPSSFKKYQTPIYLVYSIINQPYILDLGPGNSIIETLTNFGFDVYLIDFGIPGYEDKDQSLDGYITDYIQQGVKRALIHSEADALTLMGFCFGGTLAAIYAAIAEEPIKNLILLVTPLDFSTEHIFKNWSKALRDNKVDIFSSIKKIGLIPENFVEFGMRLLTSPIYISRYLSLLNGADDESYVENWYKFNKWSEDHIPIPGATVSQITKELAKENNLIKGKLIIAGKKVELSNITSNLLVASGENDRLVPIETTTPIMELASSKDKLFYPIKGGHVSTTNTGFSELLANWLPQRSLPLVNN